MLRMRCSIIGGTLLALALAACSSTAPQPTQSSGGAGSDAAACAAQGGELRPLGRLQRVQCVVPYADAGRTCSGKQDCSGQCLAKGQGEAGVAATGTCQRDISETFGCRQRVEGGVTQPALCVD